MSKVVQSSDLSRTSAQTVGRTSIAEVESQSQLLWSSKEGQRASQHIKRLRRQTVCVFSVVAVLSAAIIGVTTWSIELSNGIHTESHNLVDGKGRVVGTAQHRDVIGGIKDSSSRRLTDVTVQEVQYDTYEMDQDAFQNAFNEYVSGKAEWIADLGNGMLRTIQVLGADSGGAWGSCSSAERDLEWHVSCPIDAFNSNDTNSSRANASSGACLITTHPRRSQNSATETERRLLSRRLGEAQVSKSLAEFTLILLAEKQTAVIEFFTNQQLFTVEDLVGTTADELSQAFPAVDSKFTLGFRASVKELLALAQRQSVSALAQLSPPERALSAKRGGI